MENRAILLHSIAVGVLLMLIFFCLLFAFGIFGLNWKLFRWNHQNHCNYLNSRWKRNWMECTIQLIYIQYAFIPKFNAIHVQSIVHLFRSGSIFTKKKNYLRIKWNISTNSLWSFVHQERWTPNRANMMEGQVSRLSWLAFEIIFFFRVFLLLLLRHLYSFWKSLHHKHLKLHIKCTHIHIHTRNRVGIMFLKLQFDFLFKRINILDIEMKNVFVLSLSISIHH